MSPAREWRAFTTAVQFLTRVPLPGGMNVPQPDLTLLRACVIYFPLVGTLIGSITAGVITVSLAWWPILVAVLLGLIVEALATGAFHEDAVADCCDGFGGGWTREDVLRIMKDSRIGSFAGVGLILALGLRIAGLMSCPQELLVPVCVGSAGLGRWAILLLMWRIPPIANRDGLAKDIGQQLTLREVALGTLAALPAMLWLGWLDPWRLLAAILVVVVTVGVWGLIVVRRLGGITGDCLGAGCYFAQLGVLLVCCAGGRQ